MLFGLRFEVQKAILMGISDSLTLLYLNEYSSVMDMSVSEFAKAKGLSRGRVLHLIHSGDIQAKKIGERWLINASELNYCPRASRPLSLKMRKAFLQRLANQQSSVPLDPAERSRIEARFRQLKNAADPALLLRSWIKESGEGIFLSGNKVDLAKLRVSDKLIAFGASNIEGGLVDNGLFEAYVERSKLQEVIKSYLLVKSDRPNVHLKVMDEPIEENMMPALLLVDLAQRYGARERNLVREKVKNL